MTYNSGMYSPAGIELKKANTRTVEVRIPRVRAADQNKLSELV